MANATTSNSTKNVAKNAKGSAFTPSGTMPADKIKRYGLEVPKHITPAPEQGKGFASTAYNRQIKKSVESLKTLRQLQGKSIQGRVPQSLVNSCHYFADVLPAFKEQWADRKTDVETSLEVIKSNNKNKGV